MKKKPLTNKVGQVRELTQEDIRAMKSASEVLPTDLLKILPKKKVGQRGPQKQPTKVSVTLRYNPDVVDYFKSTGDGWQVHMNEVLEEYVVKKRAKAMNR